MLLKSYKRNPEPNFIVIKVTNAAYEEGQSLWRRAMVCVDQAPKVEDGGPFILVKL